MSKYLESWMSYDKKYKLWNPKRKQALEKLLDKSPGFVFFDAALSAGEFDVFLRNSSMYTLSVQMRQVLMAGGDMQNARAPLAAALEEGSIASDDEALRREGSLQPLAVPEESETIKLIRRATWVPPAKRDSLVQLATTLIVSSLVSFSFSDL